MDGMIHVLLLQHIPVVSFCFLDDFSVASSTRLLSQ